MRTSSLGMSLADLTDSTGGGLGIVSLILIAGAIVLMFFVVLSGVTNTTPLNKTYFLSADTSTLTGSGRATSQWTYFYVCGAGNQNCGSPVPALPLGYAWVGGTEGVPANIIGYVQPRVVAWHNTD